MNCRQAESENLYCDDQWPFLDSKFWHLASKMPRDQSLFSLQFFSRSIYIYIRVIFPMCSKLPKNWGFAHYKWLDGWTLTTATWLQPRQATPRKSWRWRNKGRPWALSWPRLKITAGWLGLGVWQERQNGGIFWALSKHYDGGKGKVDRAPLNKHE